MAIADLKQEKTVIHPLTTEAKMYLVAVALDCWKRRGGQGNPFKINDWNGKKDYGPVINLVLALCTAANAVLPSPKQIQRDGEKLAKKLANVDLEATVSDSGYRVPFK